MDQSYFELLGMPERFALDEVALEQAWRQQAAQVHPDRFATASPAEKRVAMQWASLINEAYQTLKDPAQRAAYLCERAGVAIEAENNAKMAPEFLMQQMTWREALEDAVGDAEALQSLFDEVNGAQDALAQQMTQLIDEQQDWQLASEKVRQWLFIQRIRHEIKEQLD